MFGGLAGGDAAVLLQTDRDLGLGVGALGDRVDLEQGQHGVVGNQLVEVLKTGVHGLSPVAVAVASAPSITSA